MEAMSIKLMYECKNQVESRSLCSCIRMSRNLYRLKRFYSNITLFLTSFCEFLKVCEFYSSQNLNIQTNGFARLIRLLVYTYFMHTNIIRQVKTLPSPIT